MTWTKTALGGMKQWRCRDSRGAFRIVHWSPKAPSVYRAQTIGVDGKLRTLGQAPTLSAAKALTAGAKANPRINWAKSWRPQERSDTDIERFLSASRAERALLGRKQLTPEQEAALRLTAKRKNPKAPKPLSKKALDKVIEQLYYKHASGLQINIMDIGKVFKMGEQAYAAGGDVEQAVKDAIKLYCVKGNPKKNPGAGRNPAINASAGLAGYLEAALWSSTNEDTGEPLDRDFSVSDIKGKTLAKLKGYVTKFLAAAKGLDLSGYRASQVGHDLWLTQNGHGAGFWDGDYEEPPGLGYKLDRIAKSLGEVNLYVGDDGKLYV